MIVKDKEEELKYYGAVQFNKEEAKKTLMNYPGVSNTKKGFELNGLALHDGDWIVVDEDGRSKVFSDKKFNKLFIEESEEQA